MFNFNFNVGRVQAQAQTFHSSICSPCYDHQRYAINLTTSLTEIFCMTLMVLE